MASEVVMPQMGESIAEGTITKWLVAVGDTVERDQPLFEISTDKVDAEIPSPAAGVLLEIKHGEGVTVPVNEVVAIIAESGDAAAAPPVAVAEEEAPKAAAAEAGATPPQAADVAATPEAPAKAAAVTPPAPAAAAPSKAKPTTLEERVRAFSSPLVRKIAAAEGVDLRQLSGSGIHGRVTKQDILAYLEARESAPAAPAPLALAVPPAAAAAAAGGFHVAAYVDGEHVEIEPMSKIRQITAAHMVYSRRTSAHVSTVFHFDMSKVARIRQRAKNRFFAENGTKLSYMPFIFRAITGALRKHKKLNASIDGTNVVFKKDINLGMAVALDWGLLVPVIKNADQLSLAGLAKTANDLAERARNKKLGPDELRGGTFTITNPGVFGSLFGTPVINQPQVAILGIGTIEKRPVVVTDEDGGDMIAIKTMCYFAITYDHRLVDGADAEHFMVDVRKTIEEDHWSELDPYL